MTPCLTTQIIEIKKESDIKKSLENVRISNINKLIFGLLNVNSLRNKFDIHSEQIKGSIDIFMVSEMKLDDSFPDRNSMKL